ncbi:MAG: HAMP domain-containing sensor histidine kinase [Candidatus Brocadiaceae bacterium]|jgi:signal transduction histidine kinase
MLLLLVAVLAPTACVLWFMHAAVRNERMAVRQKLEAAYRAPLDAVAEQIRGYWSGKLDALSEASAGESAALVFNDLVTSHTCDSVVVRDASGRALYPTAPRSIRVSKEAPAELAHATALEQVPGGATVAARTYAEVARSARDVNVAAQALLGRGRALVKAGQREEALRVLAVQLADVLYRNATDAHGRFIVPNALMHALELMEDPERDLHRRTYERLRSRLEDYAEPVLPSSQRRFLMRRLREVVPPCPPFATLPAEEMASRYLSAGSNPPLPGKLTPTALPEVWQMGSPDGRVIALFEEDTLVAATWPLLEPARAASGARVELEQPLAEGEDQEPFVAVSPGPHLPGWRLALFMEGSNPFAAAADRNIAFYFWTGIVVVAIIAVLGMLVARYLMRQMTLARLKNDFIATVTHELKTPLASMRVLVDTLLEGNYRDQNQVAEYLHLVSRENERLTRLIDNFLSFSRMERNKRAFEFRPVEPADLIDSAAEVVRDRFEAQGCRFDVQVEPELPPLSGDHDALVTVLLNLLDNAYKYSGDEKEISLRAYGRDGRVCLEVEDNGPGMPRRAARKVFDRFYQVDTSLSRETGGCGLGLSIVKFIVDAHGGTIEVDTAPGEGSTFTVRLPAAAAAAAPTR